MAVLTSTEYKYLLDTELGALMFPTQLSECLDIHCKRENHLEAVDWFAVEVMEAVQTAEETALPFPKAGKAGEKGMPGFCERVKPFKETLYFWHSLLKFSKRLTNNWVHNIMKRTRYKYKMKLKKCQNAENTNKRQR